MGPRSATHPVKVTSVDGVGSEVVVAAVGSEVVGVTVRSEVVGVTVGSEVVGDGVGAGSGAEDGGNV